MNFEKFKQSLAKISTKDITSNYNDGRIVSAKDLLTLTQIYPKNSSNLIVMYSKRQKNPDRLGRIEKAINLIIDRLEKIEQRLDKIEQRLERVEQRLDKVEQRLDKVEQRLDKVEQRLDKLEYRIDAIVEANHLIDPTKTKK